MNENAIYINSVLTLLILLMHSCAFYIIIKFLIPKKAEKPKKKSAPRKKPVASAKNNTAVNAAHDYQKIQTAEITIPVIAEDVLTYGPGELGAAYPDTTNLYYPESAISDEDYLKTIVRSALQVQTHEKNTSEFNRDVDGWPLESWYDKDQKKAFLKGILHGEANVNYAKENLNKPGFGTSAFISFLKIKKQEGIAPNGKKYDAIAEKLVNNHVAILPNIRDPKNVIVALNAVAKEDDETNESKEEITNNEDTTMPEMTEMTEEQFNSYMDKYNARNKEKEEMKNSIKNEIMEDLKKGSEEKTETKNEDGEKPKDEKKPKDDAANTDDKDKDDDAEAANALPSDEMLKDFSSHLGITFPKAPTLKGLAKLVGIEAKNSFDLITALNAKRKEITSGVSTDGEVKNSNAGKDTLDDFLSKI